MNVYDFDKTIYAGDSTLDFWMHCLIRYPKAISTVPGAVLFCVLFHIKLCSRESFKENFYRFLRYVPNTQNEVVNFWDLHEHKIYPWYIQKKNSSDLIISASPDFLISEICRRLNVQCIASKVNPKTGALESPNCRGEEKVRRFTEIYGNKEITEFYSDSNSDSYLAKLATQAFKVKNGVIRTW